MLFKFLVEDVGRLPSAGVCYLEGKIEEGDIKGGEFAAIEGISNQSIAIKSVALANATTSSLDTVTLSIAEPDFPLDGLRGHRLIGKA